jgi:hypothetical protein
MASRPFSREAGACRVPLRSMAALWQPACTWTTYTRTFDPYKYAEKHRPGEELSAQCTAAPTMR